MATKKKGTPAPKKVRAGSARTPRAAGPAHRQSRRETQLARFMVYTFVALSFVFMGMAFWRYGS